MRKSTKNILMMLVAGFGLQACGWLKVPGQSDYNRVSEERPLEVPPDLDEPNQNGALRVPDSTFSRVAGGPVSNASSQNSETAQQEKQSRLIWRSGNRALVLEDSLDSAYRRVGIALERVGLSVDNSDPDQNSFTVSYVDTKAKEERPGVFARWILRRKGPEDDSGTYQINLKDEDNATLVEIKDEDGAVAPSDVSEEILSALLERLS